MLSTLLAVAKLTYHDAPPYRPLILHRIYNEMAAGDDREMVNMAIAVADLNPFEKVKGIKILRKVYGLGLSDAKTLWEVGKELA